MFVIVNKTDSRILKVLQRDGRITNRDLANKVALSPSPCLVRRKRLEETGIIRGYQAMLDLKRAAPLVLVNAEVTLERNTLASSQNFEKYIQAEPSVIHALAVSGTIDYILTFCVPTLADYQQISDKMIEETGVVETLTSHTALDEIKPFSGYPLDLLLNES